MATDMQHLIITALIERLSQLTYGGEYVEEDNVMRLIDVEDPTLPSRFIIIQPGVTEELERVGHGSVRERWTLNITPMTKERHAGVALRGMRLGIKELLAGSSAGLKIPGVQSALFQAETPMLAGPGRRLSAHVMPLQVTYIQPLK